jgi:hypothetical protein
MLAPWIPSRGIPDSRGINKASARSERAHANTRTSTRLALDFLSKDCATINLAIVSLSFGNLMTCRHLFSFSGIFWNCIHCAIFMHVAAAAKIVIDSSPMQNNLATSLRRVYREVPNPARWRGAAVKVAQAKQRAFSSRQGKAGTERA